MYLLSKYKQKMVIKVCPLIKSNLNLFFASDTIEWTMKTLFFWWKLHIGQCTQVGQLFNQRQFCFIYLNETKKLSQILQIFGEKMKKIKGQFV